MKSKQSTLKLKKEVIARLSVSNNAKGGLLTHLCETEPYQSKYNEDTCPETFFSHCLCASVGCHNNTMIDCPEKPKTDGCMYSDNCSGMCIESNGGDVCFIESVQIVCGSL